jgi:hypothetical protein
MDVFYLGAAIAFFGVTWGLMKVCEVLLKKDSGDHS